MRGVPRERSVACALGVALTQGRTPVLLVHDAGDLPTSLRSLGALTYDPLDLSLLRASLEHAVGVRLLAALDAPPA